MAKLWLSRLLVEICQHLDFLGLQVKAFIGNFTPKPRVAVDHTADGVDIHQVVFLPPMDKESRPARLKK